jgi:hypothetical protein
MATVMARAKENSLKIVLACGRSSTSNVGNYLSLLKKVRLKESSDIIQ